MIASVEDVHPNFVPNTAWYLMTNCIATLTRSTLLLSPAWILSLWWDTLGASQLDRDYLEYGSRCPDVLGVAIAGPMTMGLDKPGGAN